MTIITPLIALFTLVWIGVEVGWLWSFAIVLLTVAGSVFVAWLDRHR
ncbi:hypothetical protein [Sphingomonas corticis]|jgi:UPF0716 family protein affecting phage T7 exclusion|uniref:Uncharacterized protein n=1 Tax=Sphingomonas corticis TaxID=2722791 RepID=A0ABX1CSR9_9SPHN|nr:hypothetical protein [Sphingomonas corticis]NJR80371.1 hypothetical protein [Sphingomonas corticis]